VFVWWGLAMRTPTRIAGREAVFEFLRHKLRAYQIIYLHSSTENGQPREPTLCQLYRHTFVRYCAEDSRSIASVGGCRFNSRVLTRRHKNPTEPIAVSSVINAIELGYTAKPRASPRNYNDRTEAVWRPTGCHDNAPSSSATDAAVSCD